MNPKINGGQAYGEDNNLLSNDMGTIKIGGQNAYNNN